MKRKYIPTKKDLSLAVGAALIGVVILGLIVLSISNNISRIKSEEEAAKAASEGVEQALFLKKSISDLAMEIATIDSFFVRSGEEVRFIEEIEERARQAGVVIEISSLVVSARKGSDIVEDLKMKVTFEGSWEKGRQFLSVLQSMPYAVSLTEADMRNLGEAGWRGQLNFSVMKIKE